MAIHIVTSRTRAIGNRAPVGPVALNKDSPRATGIKFLWPFFAGTDGVVRDLANTTNLVPSGTGSALENKGFDHVYGARPIARLSGQQRRLDLSTPFTFSSSDSWSIAFRVRINDINTWQIWGFDGDASDSWVAQNGTSYLRVTRNAGSLDFNGAYAEVGKFVTIVITNKISGSTADLSVYKEGILGETKSAQQQRSFKLASWFKGYNNWDFALRGFLVFGAVWSRALSDAEVWSLYDPQTRWDLYWQRRRTFFLPAAAAGGGLGIPVAMHSYRNRRMAA